MSIEKNEQPAEQFNVITKALIDSINLQIDFINKFDRLKQVFSNRLKIEWETDIEKMQFEKLRSYKGLKGSYSSEILRVEEYNIASSDFSQGELSPREYIDLITIILSGEKLIPPAFSEPYALIDGCEKKVSSATSFFDGMHRISLAKYFGLDVIPVVVFKSFSDGGYWFTPDKWKFESVRIKEEKQIEGGRSCIEYDGIQATSVNGDVM